MDFRRARKRTTRRAKTAKLKLLCNHLTVWLLSISIHSCGLSRRVPEWVCVCQTKREWNDRQRQVSFCLISHPPSGPINTISQNYCHNRMNCPAMQRILTHTHTHTRSHSCSLSHTHTQISYVAHLSLDTIWHLLHVYWSKTLCRPVCSFDATLVFRRRRDVQCAPTSSTYVSESRNCCHLVPVVSSTCSAVTVIVVLLLMFLYMLSLLAK